MTGRNMNYVFFLIYFIPACTCLLYFLSHTKKADHQKNQVYGRMPEMFRNRRTRKAVWV